MNKLSTVVLLDPVDDEGTLQYVRTYQRIVKQSPLGAAFIDLTNVYNRYVLHEDEKIIKSQRLSRLISRLVSASSRATGRSRSTCGAGTS